MLLLPAPPSCCPLILPGDTGVTLPAPRGWGPLLADF